MSENEFMRLFGTDENFRKWVAKWVEREIAISKEKYDITDENAYRKELTETEFKYEKAWLIANPGGLAETQEMRKVGVERLKALRAIDDKYLVKKD